MSDQLKATLVEAMGSDKSVVNAARVSFGVTREGDLNERDERLINFLAREKHVTPFRHPQATFRCVAPIAIARQLGKHQIGFCLTGDTEVQFVKKCNGISNGVYTKTLEDLYKMWDGQIKYQGGEKGKLNVKGSHIRVFNTSSMKFETSHISDVLYSGEKECFLITDEFGNEIKASGNHPFLTQFGWVEVKDLNVELHCLVRKGGMGDPVINYRCNDSEDVIARRDYRKSRNDSLFCDSCGSPEHLEVDHIVRVVDGGNHSTENLQLLCKTCHVEKDAHKVNVSGGGAKYVNIKAIEPIGVLPVYDISVEGHHNFIGNGFVVHNSWNEMSRRYKDGDVEVFIPQEIFSRPDDLHKGSGILLQDEARVEALTLINEAYEVAVGNYEKLIDLIAPEQARFVLPQGMTTEWIWTGSLYGWFELCRQRLSSHAQYEVRVFAKSVDEEMAKLYPISWAALKKTLEN